MKRLGGIAVGRDYYEHGAKPGQGYRNGYRTGRLKTAEGRTGRLKTAEGLMEYSAPQVAGRDAVPVPHRSSRSLRKCPWSSLERLIFLVFASRHLQ